MPTNSKFVQQCICQSFLTINKANKFSVHTYPNVRYKIFSWIGLKVQAILRALKKNP